MTEVSVNCFVMLTGYFQVKSSFKLNKLVGLWLEVVFYSFVLKLIFMMIGYTPFSVISLISCFVPVFTGRYWFITIYFGLYLISPFLNKAIYALNKEQHFKLNLLLFILASCMVSVYPSFAGMNSGGAWGLAWFIVLYVFAAWFRLYYQPSGKYIGKIIGWIIISISVATVYSIFGQHITFVQNMANNWYRYDVVSSVISTLLVFTLFLNIEIKNRVIKKCIMTIAPLTLGVYLIHAHASVSPWIWEKLNLTNYVGLNIFPIIQLGAVCLIYGVCTAIDYLRLVTIGSVNENFAYKICGLIEKAEAKMLLKLKQKENI